MKTLHIHSYSVTLEGWPFSVNSGLAIMHPKKIKRFTVLRSPHIDKKSRDQLEQQIRKSSIIMVDHNKIGCQPNGATRCEPVFTSPATPHSRSNDRVQTISKTAATNQTGGVIKGMIHPTLIIDGFAPSASPTSHLEKLPVGVRLRLDLTEIRFAYGR
jgi:hypothetical protein